MGNTNGVIWESGLDNTKGRGTGFGDDDITFSEPRGDSGPKPFLRKLGVSGGWGVSHFDVWNWGDLVVGSSGLDLGVQELQGFLHGDTGESGLLDLGVIGVEFDDVSGLVRVRERTSVEIR